MSALLLRLAAPLQSWGGASKFERRDTLRLPTKSGVVGLLACALGRRRGESLDDINSLVMAVRADQAGELLHDYHTAKTEKSTYVTNRYYLADAVFVVALEGEEALLHTLEKALQSPAFPLFLGRRSCPPVGKLVLGIRQGITAQEALQTEPWQASPWYQRRHKGVIRLETQTEVPPQTPGAYYQRDSALSFDQAHRQHGFRSVSTGSITLATKDEHSTGQNMHTTAHDALADWGQ